MSIVSISLNEDTKGNITDTRSNYNPSDNVKNQQLELYKILLQQIIYVIDLIGNSMISL